MIVLDANILIRAVLGKRVRLLLEEYVPHGVRFCAPDDAYAEAEKYLPFLLAKKNRNDAEVSTTLLYLRCLVEAVDCESYSVFEESARQRLRGRDENDWPVLATALMLNCLIWTEDTDFFGTGAAVWNTSRIEIYLRTETKSSEIGDA